MINTSLLENILFLDIETVPQYPRYEDLDDRWKALWDHKARFLAKDEESPKELYPRAGIYAEFGKIICISLGFLWRDGSDYQLRIKSFYGHDEQHILLRFSELLRKNYDSDEQILCAHNGKEFDFPYLCRRFIIHGIELPKILNIQGKKPWEIQHIDTMQLWKFGDYKSFTSLDLLAAVLEIPTPKEDMDGSMVYGAYYVDKDMERIRDYCQRDVLTLCNVLLRMNQLPIIKNADITIVK